ncbi:hypothetical protein [Aureimonas pseudogalii]|uniref:Uncharacterized protein n=1 Tax=Aureimonas pseudogalii TaxID=1744844 RepID=A0A7W6E9L3_9HYPH|nr:hypothetical protein [Aureimonas pseudogalii]MBB3997253.1 hypothetical protein [Aureimonas pseudogalii]
MSEIGTLSYRLYRTPYLVIPRLALEAMPQDWQEQFEALLVEADKAGLQTPDYHVLRDDPEFTLAERNDPEDEGSDLRFFTIMRPDPWADYRRGDAQKLSEVSR